jgi:hypothetical protein
VGFRKCLSKSGGRETYFGDRINVTRRSKQKRERRALRIEWERRNENPSLQQQMSWLVCSSVVVLILTLALMGLAR